MITEASHLWNAERDRESSVVINRDDSHLFKCLCENNPGRGVTLTLTLTLSLTLTPLVKTEGRLALWVSGSVLDLWQTFVNSHIT